VAVFGSTFNKALVLVDYQVNKNYIATVLCVNRDKPASCCKGKCYLKKTLQRQEDGDKSTAAKEKFESDWYFEDIHTGESRKAIAEITFGDMLEQLPIQFPHAIFHPPGRIVL
jgi:hypothetical protein